MNYCTSAATYIGKRKSNQDSACVKIIDSTYHGTVVFAVICDGMGGLKGGDLASASAVSTMMKWFNHYIEHTSMINERDLYEQWDAIIRDISVCFSAGIDRNERMGTTLTVMMMCSGKYYIGHVGDTRIYEITRDYIQKMTMDHSRAAEHVANGIMTEEEAELHPDSSVLTQYLGMRYVQNMRPQFFSGAVMENAVYLLCSDGLRHRVSKDELKGIFSNARTKDELTNAIYQCMDIVCSRNEVDNITAVAIKVD